MSSDENCDGQKRERDVQKRFEVSKRDVGVGDIKGGRAGHFTSAEQFNRRRRHCCIAVPGAVRIFKKSK